MRRQRASRRPARAQRGAVAVEFGLSAIVLVTALLGAMEVGRLLWTWNAAAEATRLGARLAAVCSKDEEARIKKHMQARLPTLTAANISLTYLNPGDVAGVCNANTCRYVSVALQNYSHTLLVPLPGELDTIALPSFATMVPREVMDSGNSSDCSKDPT